MASPIYLNFSHFHNVAKRTSVTVTKKGEEYKVSLGRWKTPSGALLLGY